MAFINAVNPTESLKHKIAELQAENYKLRAEVNLQSIRAERSEKQIQEIDDSCPECEDYAALKQEVEDAHCDLLEAKSLLNDELCGSKWPAKLCAKGMTNELNIMREMMRAVVAERDYKLSVAAHNYSYCQSIGAHEVAQQNAEALMDAIDQIDDDRCVKFINKVLSTVSA